MLAAILLATHPALADQPATRPAFSVIRENTLSAKPLRGYGSLAGHFTEYATTAGKHASLTMIQSPSPALAAIVLAKYNSDLRELGDITESNLTCETQTVPIAVTANQGAIAAFRRGDMVTIAAADDPADLEGLLAISPLRQAGQIDFAGGKVPVYLDMFDQYGFSVGYGGWLPPGKGWEAYDQYDYRQDFAFAKQYHIVLHHEAEANSLDTGEGVIDWPRFEANVDLARQSGIPSYLGTWAKTGPPWLMNRHPEEMQMQMPDYVGGFSGPGYEGLSYGPAPFSWTARDAQDDLLAMLAQVVRKYAHYENVTAFLEPHEEAPIDTVSVMADYGPVADAAYRNFLAEKYRTPAAVAQRWQAAGIQGWEDIHVPELASFLGWGPGAVDLKGEWRIAPDASLSRAELGRWRLPDLDDTQWERLRAPGDDRAMFRPPTRAPAIFRRTFNLPAAELNRLKAGGDGHIYLYVWDMEHGIGQTVEASLNGVSAGSFKNPAYTSSWCAFEVAGQLQAGTNLVALHLPWGELSYKIYLSPRAPRCYPDLAPGEDARWVDFRDFTTWAWANSVRRGMEMIRREDPNRFINLPAPDSAADAEKALAEDFGGEFHNTGYMSVSWQTKLPALMRSSGLPFTLEPGAGFKDLAELKDHFGRWLTEGVNGVDYIPDLRDIRQDPAMLDWFVKHQALVHLFGKYHGRPAAVAILNGDESRRLTDFPWDKFTNDLNWGGAREFLQADQTVPGPCDLILDTDFARGNADKYRVILDDNTRIMDDDLIARIEQWVRAGGIFITYGHSGQHSPLAANTWPIARLTGYQVAGETDNGSYRAIPGQTMLRGPSWTTRDARGQLHQFKHGFGLFLKKMAPECRDVLTWDNGQGIAMGIRPLGRGYVIADACGTPPEVWPDILRWCGAPVAPVTAEACRTGRFLSNNGLDEVLVLWGEKITNTAPVTLTVGDCPDDTLRDLAGGAAIKGASANHTIVFRQLELNPLETRALAVPRHAIATAPLEWLNLQRNWWQGTRTPAPAPPNPRYPNTLDLTRDCAFSPVPENARDLQPWVGAGVEDQTWPRMDLGIWSAADPEIKRGVFRKRFEVPQNWTDGQTWIWLQGWNAITLRPPYRARMFLDGKLIWHPAADRYDNLVAELSSRLQPGSHVLALETSGNTTMNGFLGNAWLEHLPAPNLCQSLAGNWGPGIDLPGAGRLDGAKKTFVPLPSGRNKSVFFFVDGGAELSGILINNRWLRRASTLRGDHFRANLTPFIHWGAENEIELRPAASGPITISHIEIRYYDPGAL